MKPSVTLRAAQQAALAKMLHLNKDKEDTQLDQGWKVLVYDKLGQDIISPLMHVGELRDLGVTVHMSIYSDRDPIPDVPAIYLVEPTLDNINRISADISRGLYDTFNLNFSSTIPRPLLETLASQCASLGTVDRVAQVYDQHVNFVSLGESLFSMQMEGVYYDTNKKGVGEAEIEAMADKIVAGLVSVVVTMECVPVIRCARGNIAEVVARKLDARLRDHVLNSRAGGGSSSTNGAAFGTNPTSSRPVLVILDRDMDLTSMLSHTWTYATLVHDVLDMALNRVTVNVDDRGRMVKRVYDLDAGDAFWSKNAGNPFPQVAENVDKEINKYKTQVEKVTNQCGATTLESIPTTTTTTDASTKSLSDAIKQLPELTLRKKMLDMHMNIATALFKSVQEREVDAFLKMEESIGKLTKQTILATIRDKSKHPTDKLRLFILFYMSTEGVPTREDMAEYSAALSEAGCSLGAVEYVKKARMVDSMTMGRSGSAGTGGGVSGGASLGGHGGGGSTPGGDLFGTFTSNLSKLTDTLQNTGVSTGLETLLSSVKNLLPARRDLAVTRAVEAMMDPISTPTGYDGYLYFDPRIPKGGDAVRARPGGAGGGFSDAIVFVVGGGNYLEYQNLQEYAQRSQARKRIVYGSTSITNARTFLNDLDKLGGAPQ